MVTINTQVVDLTLIVLSIVAGAFYSLYIFRRQKTSVKRIPLFLIWTAGFWCLFNWIGHLIAISVVSIQPIMSGIFTYTFHFYSLYLMGTVFSLLSLRQLDLIKKMSEKGRGYYKPLKRVSALIIFLSLPIIPLNPLGALPVISSVVILVTIALTKKSWVLTPKEQEKPVISPQAA